MTNGRAALLLLAIVVCLPGATFAVEGETQLLIPSPVPAVMMHARFFTPTGAGPYPLAVIAHASDQDPDRRALAPPPSFPVITAWLLARGYAVLVPQRPGHGGTGGRYLEDQGDCDRPDFVAAGNGAADSIAAAIAYMAMVSTVRRDGIIIVGNSAGGWGALALAARNPRSVAAIVNFAGGRGGHEKNRPLKNCAPDQLVAAAAGYGRTAKVPTLWLYSENDTYFPPDLSRRMADAFRAAGGKAEYHLLPALPVDGHALINAPLAATAWPQLLDKFLAKATAATPPRAGSPR